jgi:hypothetical protein
MRTLNIVAAAAVVTALLGGSAFAAERTTAAATFVDPVTQAYVGTLTQDCSGSGVNNKEVYLGVYLAQSFQVQGMAKLSVEANNAIAFSTSPRAYGEEGWLTEIGGQSNMGCLPIGAKVFLLYVPSQQLPIRVIATGTVKAI